MKRFYLPALLVILLSPAWAQPSAQKSWMLGPFRKQNAVNPILAAKPGTTFMCPVRQ